MDLAWRITGTDRGKERHQRNQTLVNLANATDGQLSATSARNCIVRLKGEANVLSAEETGMDLIVRFASQTITFHLSRIHLDVNLVSLVIVTQQDLLISSALLMGSASVKLELPETSATNARQTIGTSQMKRIRVVSPVNVWWKEAWETGQVVTRKMESVSVRIMLRAKGATAASLDIFTLILIMSLAARRAFVTGIQHSASWLPDTPKA